MMLLGGGLGLTSAPATESIMGVVRPDQAGAGSALNDATRQVGGTVGVAVLGSIYSSLYARALDASPALVSLPGAPQELARQGVAQGLAFARAAPGAVGPGVRDAVVNGFLDGLGAGCLTASAVCAVGAAAIAVLLPSRPVGDGLRADLGPVGVRSEVPA